jgi:hypothetical protein
VNTGNAPAPRQNSEKGASIFIVAAAMVVLLGLAGLGIDLVALYLGRSEAQRAADAAALAGATVFVSSSCTTSATDCTTNSTVTNQAKSQAIAAGALNLVGGTAPDIPTGTITFTQGDGKTPTHDPLITVVVNATLPTYFIKILGVNTVSISTSATAEAYNAAGSTSGPTICASCLKPFMVPNCDPSHLSPANPNCGGNGGYFLQPPNYTIANPGPYSSGGVIGEEWALHSAGPPSQWFSIAFDSDQSGSAFKANIKSCNSDAIVCGTTLQTLDGNKVGPASQGIQTLIHASGDGLGQGQDVITTTGGTVPFPITAGSSNPLVTAGVISTGAQITQSDSLVTVPVYDAPNGSINPGKNTVTVVGYMQMFIEFDASKKGFSCAGQTSGNKDDFICAVVVNVSSCGSATGGSCGSGGNTGAGGGGSGTGGTVTAGGAGFIPVRLVHP